MGTQHSLPIYRSLIIAIIKLRVEEKIFTSDAMLAVTDPSL